MAKKINLKTKLKNPAQSGENKDTTVIKAAPVPVSKKLTSKSFRLRGVDVQRLHDVTKKLNDTSNFTVSETDTIKALIWLGEKSSATKLLKAYKDAL